jgi:hypothetical protein
MIARALLPLDRQKFAASYLNIRSVRRKRQLAAALARPREMRGSEPQENSATSNS